MCYPLGHTAPRYQCGFAVHVRIYVSNFESKTSTVAVTNQQNY